MTCCRDCPRNCGALRPDSSDGLSPLPGFCASPLRPRIARAGLHFWEEPVISGNRGSGTVFFSGCNLRCAFCQNYEISALHHGTEISIERLKEIYRELIARGAHNINLVTPTHYLRAILASLDEKLPVPVVYNSNGYENVESLRLLDGKIQIYLPDLKYADNTLALRYSNAPHYFETATRAIDEMFRQIGPYRLDENGILQRGVVIRHLVLPGHLADSAKIIDYVKNRFRSGDVLFSLMRQYLPCGKILQGEFPELNRKLSYREIQRIEKILFSSGIEDGFLQDGSAARSEFIPAFDGTGVSSPKK
ncbi:MAG: radical SAM protein [Victivallaceae bacterium]|nr:radical SAM protein [Victivallaceae bacterium]